MAKKQRSGTGGRIYSIPTPVASSNEASKKKAPKEKAPKYDIHDLYEREEPKDQVKYVNPKWTRINQYEKEPESFELDKIVIDREDDEEIDEDEAFNVEDEQRYGDHFAPSKKQSMRFTPSSKSSMDILSENEHLEDDEESEPSDFEQDDDAVDMSELLSPSVNILNNRSKKTIEQDEILNNESYSDLNESEDDSQNDSDESDTNQLSENLSILANQIKTGESNLKTKKDAHKNINSKFKPDQSIESYPESEFYVPQPLDSSSNVNELSMDTLLQTLHPESTLKTQLKHASKQSKKNTKISAPLSVFDQKKLDREVAYTATKKEVEKWLPVIQNNRKKDHLVFPNLPKPLPVSNSTLTETFKAETELETAVDSILKSSGMSTDKSIKETEELGMNKISPLEIQARRAELQKMRSLMFFTERKLQRASKIKSKLYHKIKKKEREKEMEKKNLSIEELDQLDPEAANSARMDLERIRAEERISQRHKKGSKWTKKLLDFREQDDDTRMAVLENLSRHEKLTRRIQGKNSDNENSSDSDSSDSADDDSEKLKMKLEQIKNEIENSNQNTEELKGIHAMKFMKKAVEERRVKAVNRMKELQKEFELSGDENEFDVQSKKKNSGTGSIIMNNEGRMKFGKHLNQVKKQVESSDDEYEKDSDDEVNDDAEIQTSDKSPKATSVTINKKTPANSSSSVQVSNEDISDKKTVALSDNLLINEDRICSDSEEEDSLRNPWLKPVSDQDQSLKMEKKNIKSNNLETNVNSKSDFTRSTKVSQKMMKTSQKILEKEIENELKRTRETFDLDEENEEENEEGIELITYNPNQGIRNKKAELDFESQRDLIQMAFATDNLVADEFEEEKQQEIESKLPKSKDITLPGWGSWAGSGIRPSKRRYILKPDSNEDPNIIRENRKDSKLKHVIINESKNSKFQSKYVLEKIPFPFKTKEQYQNSLRFPVGKEWNTMTTHKNMVRPKIKTKLGSIIDPIKYNKKDAELKEEFSSDEELVL